jgi:hypothetical protein
MKAVFHTPTLSDKSKREIRTRLFFWDYIPHHNHMPPLTPHEREAYWKTRAEQLPFWQLAKRREAAAYVPAGVRRRLVGRVALGACAFVLGWGALQAGDSTCSSVALDTPPPVELQLTNGSTHITPATELQMVVPESR